ncbi:MAG: DUF4902 domain-containing protein [Comamonadaceae bacterium]|nr:MAG: DUF4902 domain-containing protein [Comamonadaceae bacterium]
MKLQTSERGLLCMRQSDLSALQLVHLLSGMDDDEAQEGVCGGATTLSGYTEWVSPQAATLTLGWDWQLASGAGQPSVKRLGLPRTNIQVVDGVMRPLPWEVSLQVLAEYIDRLEWASPAFEAVCQSHVN